MLWFDPWTGDLRSLYIVCLNLIGDVCAQHAGKLPFVLTDTDYEEMPVVTKKKHRQCDADSGKVSISREKTELGIQAKVVIGSPNTALTPPVPKVWWIATK